MFRQDNEVKIDDRTFLVSGGGSGLGAATASMLVEQGGKVAVVDINAATGRRLADL